MVRRIYLASSWRNEQQPEVVSDLRSWGHEVYDFRHPAEGIDGFSWSSVDPGWKSTWTPHGFLQGLRHPLAEEGYFLDWRAMQWADTGVLLLPCGKSAHLEAGYFVGAGKTLIVVLERDRVEPELMYRMATSLCVGHADLRLLLDPP